MPVYDMSCPKCGQQTTEYDENKWQCLHCGDKFVYKQEPAATFNTHTNVTIAPSALYDIEVGDPVNNRPLLGSWLKAHKAEEDEQMARDLKAVNKVGCLVALAVLVLAIVAAGFQYAPVALGFVVLAVILAVVAVVNTPEASARIRARKKYLASLQERIGTIILCPYCHEKYSECRFGEEEPQELTHCMACGKQFLVAGLNSYKIKFKQGGNEA